MNLNDPARPRLSGTDVPLILGSNTCIVPAIYICHDEGDCFDVAVWVQRTGEVFTYSARHRSLRAIEIASLLMRYLADPEKTLKEEFEWTLKEPTKQLPLTLADLEL